jgi:regulator of replication initiation timing
MNKKEILRAIYRLEDNVYSIYTKLGRLAQNLRMLSNCQT